MLFREEETEKLGILACFLEKICIVSSVFLRYNGTVVRVFKTCSEILTKEEKT